MAAEKLRVGLIGANVSNGWSPRAHLPALRALPEIELAAVCTAHEETARESAERFGVPLPFHDHREMLRDADLDVVAVSVRVPLHYRLTMDSLRAKNTSSPSGRWAPISRRPKRWRISPLGREC